MKTLTEQIARMRGTCEHCRDLLRSGTGARQEVHEAEENVKAIAFQLPKLERAVDEDRMLAARIDGLVIELEAMPYQSRDRALALTYLENAALRLRKEVGL